MTKPHVHAALIKAWAEGATIQYFNNITGRWEPAYCGKPSWDETTQYRVKPEPKPDRIETRKLAYDPVNGTIWLNGGDHRNIVFVFDGETGVLKDCQLLVKE
jgi:hypothetical protein